ncbi:23S rRNA (guanosine(2251)-2'-O)-methyltransferase RlmB [Mycoplasma flocculare]|uniref:tRNA/rRNA methyltransferase n=2 Tax=Mesomycoplasma flocculare TaxID=2128 RepID=A0A0A8E7C3_MESFC|nr:23S rRNA (guanosine(2251)-2'-O)-methyltransferase RlmB [Mesomycoplasma flocculare]MXR39655.1 23S rRNA (guanosine(2251)-2'-O)-methyltransferase RlmB [Mycoplasma sp. MF12]AJC50100.1 tRNA/rRNA methyltransferase [Mesomycoplasma flocculare ATCC 27399]ENX50798.1 tRNA/rRNA methyltransferase [Mesomycoplasma flocculare ATCC 27716]MXR06082.1 23S rRNA (guanosine(2251)-2'-O)-methyltransferase RlmB [Mesomycoplasma flocculare]MXR12228.1 23S rRNA (guanosine(2251)-2'-O)-methyltransferase RlmB [Mesomycoplas
MVKYVCGKNSLVDAIKNGYVFKEIYLLKPITDIIFLNQKVKIVSREFLDKLVSVNHQGFVGVVENFRFFEIDILKKDRPEIVLVLDHIYDQNNLGNIIRTANCFGIQHLILPKRRAAKLNETTLKVSSGGFVGIKFILVNSIVAAINTLKRLGFWIYATDLNEKSIKIQEIQFNYPCVIILGNESTGIQKSTSYASDQTFFIPIEGTVDSLNVTVATGIILFFLKQNKK